MPNLVKVLKEEIRRLARKEVKEAATKLAQTNVELRKRLTEHKRRIASLERAVAKAQRTGRVPAPQGNAEEDGAPRLRISSKTIYNTRSRMGLTQVEFGKLLGVSGQSVYQWERKDGQLRLRHATREAFSSVKDFGAREARKRLAELEGTKRGRRKRSA